MGTPSRCALLAVLIFAGTACPRPAPKTFDYTSADLRQGARYSDALDAANGGGGAEGDDGAPSPAVAPDRQIVEPDVIQLDGNLLFVLNQYRGLTLVDLNDQTIVSRVPTYGYPRDLYIVGDRAYVLVAYAADYHANGNTVSYDIQSRLYVVDIADPAEASVIASFALEGDLVDSRLVGDVLYAVSAEFTWYWGGVGEAVKGQAYASWVTSINVADEGNIHERDRVSFDGIGNVIHTTPSAIFVASSAWETDSTAITYIDISDPSGAMAVRDEVTVAGQVADRFKMDVWEGVLRVVSSAWQDQRRTFVTTIDIADPDDLAVMAQTEFERAQGEALFATRFDGPRAYVVTYLVIDPLFVVNLSDPANPQVVGELEVPGWSTHIEPQGDRLLALGVDDTTGRHVSVSLFDVADPANPGLIDRISFGENWSWSSAYSDVKALTVLDDLVIVPFSGWEETGGFERLQFVSYDENDLDQRGAADVQGSVLRSFEHGGSYYGVTTEQLARIDADDLDSPEVVDSLPLAENVSDFVELSPDLGVEIITQHDTGATVLRKKDLPFKGVAAEAAVDIGQYVSAYAFGDSVVAVGASWSDTPSYKVAFVDFSQPDAPEIYDVLDVEVTPYYGYWWYLPYVPLVEIGATDALIAPWIPIRQQGSSMLVGDRLVLRCTANSFDAVIGSQQPNEGLAIVDIASREWTSTVGLGFEQVVSVAGQSDAVYIASKEGVDAIPFSGEPMCAYFVTAFNPATGDAGPTVNVPGMLVQYDPATDVLTLRDDQWTQNYTYTSLLTTVAWDGGDTATALDEQALPAGSANVLGRGARVFMDGYDQGSRLYVAEIGANGDIALGDGVLVTNDWANLIDARGTSAYFSIGGGAIARYDCSGASTLEELVEVMGAPAHIRFGANAAYAPLGYFGIVQLGL